MKRILALASAGAFALAGCGEGGNGGSAVTAARTENPVVETFRNPPELRSQNGELRTTLTVAPATVQLAGKSVTTTVYNGSWIPPVLRLRPGEQLLLDLDNRAAEPTNEHFHGLNVSPGINADATVSDNVFVHVEPGSKVSYRIAIPPTHNSGLYWYHTHQHGIAQRQVMGGLSGGLVIDGVLDPLPQLQGITERIMLLKDIQITPQGTLPDDIDPSAPSDRMVNGQVNPTLVIRPGETQFLRLGNIGSDVYYKLKLDGHVFHELARDGNRHNQLVTSDELLLPPGSRSEVLIQGAAQGTYLLRALAFDTGPAGDSYPEATLATLVSQGQAQTPIALPTALPAVEDLRTLPVARRRTITFVEDTANNTFFIDSGNGPLMFDANRIDSTIPSGTVEEWTVLNATPELHVFHIHQTDFQVTEINGVAQPFVGHQDNINVSYQPDASSAPGQVKLLIDFRNPLIVGKFVYHCHILEHEDGGMMAVAEVVKPAMAAAAQFGATLVKAVNRTLGRSAERGNADEAARIEQTLSAVQAGSYCRTEEPRAASQDATR
ncbi:multicopper oxidase family protein [Noviherbaspirillum cavernae]|uniref:Multicopper oxidase family protein n=1 Tax=Noviherbaspirillum cavernae TaxID=2320862 RepID=A0A418WVX1_9BURK|nr:multicopper oxidase family protein [Noviherbaspirillum cavernae]RJF96739.1 multicopper oxidase family protein [Noviherbaspirillum cavernae]